jgi:UDP-N-acetylmuramoyl-tripeptide--D-alanyl-D-alanine ligase
MARLAGVSIDSRTVGRGELFVAIHGARHDGHDFVAAALERGAAAAVVRAGRLVAYPGWVRDRLLGVDDTLAALHRLARAVRRSWREGRAGRRLAAVTGSAGKTTTKEILAALLAARFRVLKSEANLNNEYGAPLMLLRLEETHDAAVLELGMSRRGELARLAEIAEPEIGVVTCVAPAHLEFFASVEEIALAKRELIEGLYGSECVAVLNADDPRVARFSGACRGRVLTFGFGAAAQFRAENIEERGAAGCAFDYVSPAGRARLELPLAGRHNVLNALAALAAASGWGVGAREAELMFPAIAPQAMRGRWMEFAEGFTLINDCYNSNPQALERMIELLAETPGFRRKILVAGEMLELGDTSPELHRAAGRLAAERKVDWIFGVQGLAKEILAGAVAAGHPSERAQFFANSEDAAAALAGFFAAGDLALVKGSRGVRMERVVEAVAARHARAEVARR